MRDLHTIAFKRRKLWVDHSQQLKFALDMTLYALLFPLLVVFLLYVEPFAGALLRTDSTSSRRVVADFLHLCQMNWWIPLVALVVLAVISILFSHKIVGPIHRFEKNLKRRLQGESDIGHFGVRDGDYFKSFGQTLQHFIDHKIDPKNFPPQS